MIEGDADLLSKIRPAFLMLADKLEQGGSQMPTEMKLLAFAEAFEIINKYEDEIETIEREAILETMYDIGELVGLDRTTEFAEEWRGDW
jgi:hypothetical protein